LIPTFYTQIEICLSRKPAPLIPTFYTQIENCLSRVCFIKNRASFSVSVIVCKYLNSLCAIESPGPQHNSLRYIRRNVVAKIQSTFITDWWALRPKQSTQLGSPPTISNKHKCVFAIFWFDNRCFPSSVGQKIHSSQLEKETTKRVWWTIPLVAFPASLWQPGIAHANRLGEFCWQRCPGLRPGWRGCEQFDLFIFKLFLCLFSNCCSKLLFRMQQQQQLVNWPARGLPH